jgi:hypothetical protein
MLSRVLALSLLLAGCAQEPEPASPSIRAKKDVATAPTSDSRVFLFVDRDSPSTLEEGTPTAPYRTITRALERARELRYGCPTKGIVPSGDEIVIHVRSAATHIGSFDPAVFDPGSPSFDPTKERLPLLLNISRLQMVGGGELAVDEQGLPVSMAPGTAVTLRADRQQGTKQYLVLVHRSRPLPGCGYPEGFEMAGDDVTIRGFFFDGRAADSRTGLFPTAAIGIDRVGAFDVRGNELRNSPNGIWTSQASGQIRENLASANTTLAFIVNGGSTLHPAMVTVSRNRANANPSYGLALGGAGETGDGRRDLDLGANAFVNVPHPVFDRSINPEAIPDTLEARVIGNDLSGNGQGSVRAAAYFAYPYKTANESQEEIANIVAEIEANICRDNGRHGLVFDSGFTHRADPRRWTATMTLSLGGNQLENNGFGPAYFGFTRYQESINAALGSLNPANSQFRYLRDSSYDVTADLTDFDHDNRAADPIDGSVTGNVLRVNGVAHGGATGAPPEVCIFDCPPANP